MADWKDKFEVCGANKISNFDQEKNGGMFLGIPFYRVCRVSFFMSTAITMFASVKRNSCCSSEDQS